MPDKELLKLELEKLAESRKATEKLLEAIEKKGHKPKPVQPPTSKHVKWECRGLEGEGCPHKAYKFSKSKMPKEWVCTKCYEEQAAKEKNKEKVIWAGPDGPNELAKLIMASIDHYEEGPNGEPIPVLISGKALYKRDQRYLKLKNMSEDNVSPGYFWCKKYKFPWEEIKPKICPRCNLNQECEAYLVWESEQKVKELQKQLRDQKRGKRDIKK